MNGVTTAAPPATTPTHVRYLVLAALCAVTAINYVQRNCIGGAETTIRADLNLTIEQTGLAASDFFFAYALLQIPSGMLAQRLGPRRALTLYTVGWSAAIGLAALAEGLLGLRAARLAMGAFQAGIFPCATLVMGSWLPPARRALASGLLNSFMLIGGAMSANLTGLLIGRLGWRGLFLAFALPGFVWAAWFYWRFRDRPQDHPRVNPAELAVIAEGRAAPSSAPALPWWFVFVSVTLLLIMVQQFCRAGANRILDTWYPTFLQEEHLRGVYDPGVRSLAPPAVLASGGAAGGGLELRRHESVRTANQLASIPLWAGVVGGLIGGGLSDAVLRRWGRRAGRQGVAVGSLAVSVALYLLAYQAEDLMVGVWLISLAFAVSAFSSPCAYALTMDMGGRNIAVVFGAMNMAGNFGAWAAVKYVAQLRQATGSWEPVLAVYVGMHVVAIVGWLLLNPNGTLGERPAAQPPK